MKKIINPIQLIAMFTIAIFFLLNSCTSEQPKCNDDDVKEILFDIVKEQLQIQLEDTYYQEKYNYSDVRNYARDNNMNVDSVNKKVELRIKEEAREYAISKISEAVFKLNGIRVLNIDEELKKCDCAAELLIENFETKDPDLEDFFENMLRMRKIISSGMEIKYTAQLTEDDQIYVEAYY